MLIWLTLLLLGEGGSPPTPSGDAKGKRHRVRAAVIAVARS